VQFGAPDKINEFLSAAQTLSEVVFLKKSIDDVLFLHSNNASIISCGKIAIAKAILKSERHSIPYEFFSRSPQKESIFKKLRDTWYGKFFSIMTEGVKTEDLGNLFDNICVIDFNYDRVLEIFLIISISSTFKISIDQATSAVGKLKMYHPYGYLGRPTGGASGEKTEFGADTDDAPSLWKISQRIRTYTEQIIDDDIINNIRFHVDNAQLIVFLGFAYHKQNLQILFSNDAPRPTVFPPNVYGTAIGISSSDQDWIKASLSPWIVRGGSSGGIVLRSDLTCVQLFAEYGLTFSQR